MSLNTTHFPQGPLHKVRKDERFFGKRFLKQLFLLLVLFSILFSGLYYFFKTKSEEIQKESASQTELGDDLQTFMNRVQTFINLADQIESTEDLSNSFQQFYQTFPTYNQTKPSSDDLSLYLKYWHASIKGKIKFYTAMTTKDSAQYLEDLRDPRTGFANEKTQVYYYWLEVENEASNEVQSYPFVLWLNEQGKPTLPENWILQSNKMYELLDAYFQALKSENKELVSSYLAVEENNSEILAYKLQSLMKYYKDYFSFPKNWENRMKLAAFFGYHLQVPQRINNDIIKTWKVRGEDNSSYLRYMGMTMDKDDNVYLNDTIPMPFEEDQFTVYNKNRQKLVTLGQIIDVTDIINDFGWWADGITVSDFAEEKLDSKGRQMQKIVLEYPGIRLEIHGLFVPNDNYIYGNLVDVQVSSEEYSVGHQLKVGQSALDVYEVYPYLKEQENVLSRFDGKKLYFQFSDQLLKVMHLEWDNSN